MECQREKFVLDDGIVYLTTSSHALKLKSTVQAQKAEIDRLSKVWNLVGDGMSQRNLMRKHVSEIMKTEPKNIAWVSSTSFAISLVAQNLVQCGKISKDTKIIILKEQFWSNVFAWQNVAKITSAELVCVEADTDHVVSAIKNASNVVAALPMAHWANGKKLDLKLIGAVIRETDNILIVDGTQSLGAVEIDIHEIDPDFFCASCYKWLLGPSPGAVLYVKAEWQEKGVPLVFHLNNASKYTSGLSNFSKLNIEWNAEGDGKNIDFYFGDLCQTAQRFDVGGNVDTLKLAALNNGLAQILEWGVKEIENYVRSITDMIAEYFEKINLKRGEEVFIFPKIRVANIIGVRHKYDIEFADKVTAFMKERNIHVVARCKHLRISPYVYTNKADVRRFCSAMDNFLTFM